MPLYNIHVFASNNFQRALAATLYGHEKYSNNIDFLTFLWRKSFFFHPQGLKKCQLCKRLAEPIILFSWSGNYGCDHYYTVQSTTIFQCIKPFSACWQTKKWTNNQKGNPWASLLMTSEKEVFCNWYIKTYYWKRLESEIERQSLFLLCVSDCE